MSFQRPFRRCILHSTQMTRLEDCDDSFPNVHDVCASRRLVTWHLGTSRPRLVLAIHSLVLASTSTASKSKGKSNHKSRKNPILISTTSSNELSLKDTIMVDNHKQQQQKLKHPYKTLFGSADVRANRAATERSSLPRPTLLRIS